MLIVGKSSYTNREAQFCRKGQRKQVYPQDTGIIPLHMFNTFGLKVEL